MNTVRDMGGRSRLLVVYPAATWLGDRVSRVYLVIGIPASPACKKGGTANYVTTINLQFNPLPTTYSTGYGVHR